MRKVLYIFGLLTDSDIEWMATHGAVRRLADGEVLIEEGGTSDSLILLLEGELQATARGYGSVGLMGAGEIVGEMSLVDSAPPSATITVRGEALGLLLDKRTLLDKLGRDDGFGSRFYHALAVFLADRLRSTRPATETILSDNPGLARDELDVGVMDRVTAAGERFNRMLRILSVNL
jgi:CRP/FNR family transcriptional regulator, cyclic AMP receptor protein